MLNTETTPSSRIYFIDALRAFAILMMLQGHFISGLLDPVFKDNSSILYRIWLYCRGFTAPVFFTITGWIFTFLLLQNPTQGWSNPRIRMGLKRAAELLLWGYLLRLNIFYLLLGKINPSFFQPDVLHIIGLSLVFILVMYVIGYRFKYLCATALLMIGLFIFITQPLYTGIILDHLPKALAGYLVKGNGGVFYLFPWLGYVCIGAFIAYIFPKKVKYLWAWSLVFLISGLFLILQSSFLFLFCAEYFNIPLLKSVSNNNFLFIRLGDVFVLFGLFIFLQPTFKNKTWKKIGTNTLSIYITHYFLLYGSLTGVGLYKFLSQQLNGYQSVLGALLFTISITLTVLYYKKYQNKIRCELHDYQLQLKQLLLSLRRK